MRATAARAATPGGPRRSAVVVFVALIATVLVGVGVVTDRKRAPSYLQGVRVSRDVVDPRIPGGRGAVHLGFVTKRADRARVSVIAEGGRTVRVLGPGKDTRPYRRVSFGWRPVDRAGRPLPTGRYRFRIELSRSGRDLVVDDAPVRVARP